MLTEPTGCEAVIGLGAGAAITGPTKNKRAAKDKENNERILKKKLVKKGVERRLVRKK